MRLRCKKKLYNSKQFVSRQCGWLGWAMGVHITLALKTKYIVIICSIKFYVSPDGSPL